jgi:hypothetical protein
MTLVACSAIAAQEVERGPRRQPFAARDNHRDRQTERKNRGVERSVRNTGKAGGRGARLWRRKRKSLEGRSRLSRMQEKELSKVDGLGDGSQLPGYRAEEPRSSKAPGVVVCGRKERCAGLSVLGGGLRAREGGGKGSRRRCREHRQVAALAR